MASAPLSTISMTVSGFPRTPGLGVADPDMDAIVDAALRDPSTGGNPVKMTPENTRALYEAIL